MIGMERNKQTFWYALYERSEPIYDEYGNEVGEKPIYSKPFKTKGNISAARGRAEKELFGIHAVYTKTINPMPKNFPVDESSILWIDNDPLMDEDGNATAGHDYVVSLVAKSLNHKAYAVSRVDSAIGGDEV